MSNTIARLLVALLLGLAVSTQGAAETHDAGDTTMTDSPTSIRELMDKGDAAMRQRSYAEARKLWQQAADLATSQDADAPVRTETLAAAARGALLAGDTDAATGLLKQAEAFASKDAAEAWSRYQGVRGRLQWKQGELEDALATFGELFAYCSERSLHNQAVDAGHMAAIVASKPELQREWTERTIHHAEAHDQHGWLPMLYNNQGWNFYDVGEYQDALTYLLKAREHHWKGQNELSKLIADYSVGAVYVKLHDYDAAGVWLRPTLAWAERLDATGNEQAGQWLGYAAYQLGNVAAARDANEEAHELWQRAAKRLKTAGADQWDAETWGDLQAKLGNVAEE